MSGRLVAGGLLVPGKKPEEIREAVEVDRVASADRVIDAGSGGTVGDQAEDRALGAAAHRAGEVELGAREVTARPET